MLPIKRIETKIILTCSNCKAEVGRCDICGNPINEDTNFTCSVGTLELDHICSTCIDLNMLEDE